ncbi:glycosyltransferase family 4 protein [Pseudomonas fuscovaginae UPB0736]|uniref:glycosyltransferase family 4 protein n=1 Tax=Pseudomonas asplenii TaxID=53407 RepID=UPI000289120B|nr:glycosyltransferase family 4 protein [Pseudomonas fuscovaginae]UUQ63721.1 glycosyltransferase family 4 protein [Pseudomonas fuscovaginae UPB0736]
MRNLPILQLSLRVARVLRRYASGAWRAVRVARIQRLQQFGWSVLAARTFTPRGEGFHLDSDDSDWGYQLRSVVITTRPGQMAVLSICGELTSGAMAVGCLNADASSWLGNYPLPKGRFTERFVVDPGSSESLTLVFSNAQGGPSSLDVSTVLVEWMPADLARLLGDSESSIVAEIERQIADASPYPLLVNGVPGADNKIPGTGVYLRTDYWVNITAGGSYGHTCYVAQELAECTENLVCFMANRFDLLDTMGIEQVIMDKPSSTCNEIDVLKASRFFYQWLRDRLAELKPAYIYERAILGSYVGAQLSRELGIPYILEYNGSEISMKRSFDERGYELETAFAHAEQAAFAQATTIVAISKVIEDGLIQQGIPAEKILFNPNGCSPEHYTPIDIQLKREMRVGLGWEPDNCVVGFIGTFGGWHGIDVLAEALPLLCERDPNLRFLLIGDGNFRHLVDEAVKRHHLQDRVFMPGTVAQTEAARLLSCSDILISPHNRHMVDSKFFGSPTKLFEYMALGGAIVASRLEQIGDVLTPSFDTQDLAEVDLDQLHGQRAVLCKPGDTEDFVNAVAGLAARPDLWPKLGANARQALLDNYTWKQHVHKILRHVAQRSAALKEKS